MFLLDAFHSEISLLYCSKKSLCCYLNSIVVFKFQEQLQSVVQLLYVD
jgi:hypothetical protein